MKKRIFQNWRRLSSIEPVADNPEDKADSSEFAVFHKPSGALEATANGSGSQTATPEVYVLPDNSILAEQFRQNHPQPYKFMMRLQKAPDCKYLRMQRGEA